MAKNLMKNVNADKIHRIDVNFNLKKSSKIL